MALCMQAFFSSFATQVAHRKQEPDKHGPQGEAVLCKRWVGVFLQLSHSPVSVFSNTACDC